MPVFVIAENSVGEAVERFVNVFLFVAAAHRSALKEETNRLIDHVADAGNGIDLPARRSCAGCGASGAGHGRLD
jgi:hypothetical protein